jgi:glycosyltransferase involved in cell wall biosynthesis
MRALVIHNFYRSENASGENLSVLDEIAGLRDLGWDIELIGADSDVIGTIDGPLFKLGLRPIYSSRSVRRTAEAIKRFRPNVALVENVFPLHSPWVIRTLRTAGVPVAAGVRSYRMVCAGSTLFRDGSHCDDCVGSFANLPAIRHGCFQDSRMRTVPIAASLALHRSTFRQIDTFLAVSEHVRDELAAAGFPADRIVIRPNFVPDPGPPDVTVAGADFIFGGRLVPEKGIDLMIEAWRRSEVWKTSTLRVAGTGPMGEFLGALDPKFRVEQLGLVEHEALMEVVRTSAVTVVPSIWPEPFGRGVIEAAARARPSLVCRSGGLQGLVVDGETGWIADPDPDDFAAGFRRAADPEAQIATGAAARQRFVERYTSEVSVGILHDTLMGLAVRA